MGLRVQVFETGDDVGGTWYWNRYPGARCDSESYIYCYSFDKDLMQEWEWSGKYPEQPEILRYLNHVADRHDLRRNIKFETRVTARTGTRRPTAGRSRPTTATRSTAQFLITAIGCLSSGQVPKIPGLDTFEGDWYHTGAWPHDGRRLHRQARRRHRHGLERRAVDPGDRQAGRAPHRLPAHAAVHASRPATAPSTRRSSTRSRRATTRSTRSAASRPAASRTTLMERSALAVSDEERNAIFEAGVAGGRVPVLLSHVQRHRPRPAGQRHRRPSSSATRSARP